MKILYAIQGTGNGHLSRAMDIVPILQRKGELDILVSGIQADIELPYPIKYKFKGLSFIFGKKGGIDLLATYRKSNLKQLFKEIKSLPIETYDLVISDFEPVSAWACVIKQQTCIGLSHQEAVMNSKSPKPKKADALGKAILHNYAPVSFAYGFHFMRYDSSIYTPVIRSQVRQAVATDENHFTVYLPAWSDDRIIKVLKEIPEIEWQVFSKHSDKTYQVENIRVMPVQNDAFIKSFTSCSGILCGAGFETPAEALFLQKKLMVIPMKGQYEQQCNAAALAQLGVPVIRKLKLKHLETIREWTKAPQILSLNYPNQTEQIIDHIIQQHVRPRETNSYVLRDEPVFTVKKLQKASVGKIIKDTAGAQ